jgi:hypothetical protein
MSNVTACRSTRLDVQPFDVDRDHPVELSKGGLSITTEEGNFHLTHDLKLSRDGDSLRNLGHLERFTFHSNANKVTVTTAPGEDGRRKIDSIVTTDPHGGSIATAIGNGCNPDLKSARNDSSRHTYTKGLDVMHPDGLRVDSGDLGKRLELEHNELRIKSAALGNSRLKAEELGALTNLGSIDATDYDEYLRKAMNGRTVGEVLENKVPADAKPLDLLKLVVAQLHRTNPQSGTAELVSLMRDVDKTTEDLNRKPRLNTLGVGGDGW